MSEKHSNLCISTGVPLRCPDEPHESAVLGLMSAAPAGPFVQTTLLIDWTNGLAANNFLALYERPPKIPNLQVLDTDHDGKVTRADGLLAIEQVRRRIALIFQGPAAGLPDFKIVMADVERDTGALQTALAYARDHPETQLFPLAMTRHVDPTYYAMWGDNAGEICYWRMLRDIPYTTAEDWWGNIATVCCHEIGHGCGLLHPSPSDPSADYVMRVSDWRTARFPYRGIVDALGRTVNPALRVWNQLHRRVGTEG